MKQLVEKLSKIMDELGAVEKSGRNDFHKYSYMSHADLMKSLHPLMVKHGVVMHPAGVENQTVEHGRVVTVIRYEVTDGESSLPVYGVGEGVDKGDKSAYKAQTGAHKYALKALFSIPDELDAEGDVTTDADPEEIPRKYNMSKKDLIDAIGQYNQAKKIPKEVVDSWKSPTTLNQVPTWRSLKRKTFKRCTTISFRQ